MRRFLLHITLVFSVFSLLGTSMASLAQEATPETYPESEFPLAPDTALCTVEGRTTEEIIALWFPAGGTPVADVAEDAQPNAITIPVGMRADADTTASIVDTVLKVFSCSATGDFRRVAALFTDTFLAATANAPDPGMTSAEAAAALDTWMGPEGSPYGPVEIVTITEVMQLEDGRVGAIVVTRGLVGTAVVYTIFEQVDGRWLVDEVIDFRPFD